MAESVASTGASPQDLTGLGQSFRALRHRNFRLFLAGQLVSLSGSWMQSVAQSWLVYRLTHSEWLLGTTAFCTHIPVLLLGPLAGVAADRYDRRKMVLITQTLFALQAAAMAWLTLAGRIEVSLVLALALFLGCVNAFDVPARQSLMIHMTTRDDLLSAIALNSAMFNTARVLGPSVGGIVVAVLGEGHCFLLNAVSFLAVIGGLLAMDLPAVAVTPRTAPMEEIREGFRYAWREAPVRRLLLILGTSTLCAAPVLVLAPVFADAIFEQGSRGLGFLSASLGAGAVAGALSLAGRGGTEGLAGVVRASSLAFAAGLIGFAGSPHFVVSLAVSAALGFFIFRQNASANTLIQTSISDEFRGRIMSIYSMMAIGLIPIGSLLAGAMAARFGARPTVLASGVAALAAVTLFSRKSG